VVRPWVKWDLYWAVRFDYTEKVKLAFDAAGIEIPYPQRQVHLIAPEEGLKIRLLPESQLQELPQQDSRKSVQEQP
ncbi:MAG: hypothetical protein ACAI44_38130, partial [Candidatus Sericytochromatia bacterium]